jgi:beta-xylosidase
MKLTIGTIFSAAICLLTFFPSTWAWTNPIRNPGGSDPFIAYSGGYYYLLTTEWSTVEIARSTTINGLKTATKKVIYSDSTASHCCNVWAPEVHYLGGKWYVYFTAGNGDNLDGQRLHVLAGEFPIFTWLSTYIISIFADSVQAAQPPGTTTHTRAN